MRTPKPPKVLSHFCNIFLFTFLPNSVSAQSRGDDIFLSYATLQSPETQTAKKVLVDDLKDTYNKFENLNSSLKSEYQSSNQVLSILELPDDGNENVGGDLGRMSIIEECP